MATIDRAIRAFHSTTAISRSLSVLLFLVLMLLALQLIIDLRRPAPATAAAPTVSQPGFTQASRNASQHLAEEHLFGTPPMPTDAQVPISQSSSVKVIGIVSGDDALHSSAILEIDGQQHAYATGATLPDGEKLADIGPDGVTLERNGSRYRVLMDIQAADANARFTTLAVGQDGVASTIASQPFKAPPSPDEAMEALRAQLVEKLRNESAAKNGPAQPQTNPVSLETDRPKRGDGSANPPWSRHPKP